MTLTHLFLQRLQHFRAPLQATGLIVKYYQKPIRVETCNGPLCAGKQASEYSIS